MSIIPKPVTVAITCSILPEKAEIARKELASVIKVVLDKEPACRGIRVHEDPKYPQRLFIIEYWDSEEIFSGPHMQTPHMQTFLKKAKKFLDGEVKFTFWREFLVAPALD